MEYKKEVEANSCALKKSASLQNKKTEKQKSDEALRNQCLTMRNLKQEIIPQEIQSCSVSHDSCTEEDAVNALLLLSQKVVEEIPAASTSKTFCDKGIQVDFEDFNTSNDVSVQVNTSYLSTVSDFVHTDKNLSSLTGIHSFSFLTAIVMVLSEILKDSRLHKLSIKNRLFLTLMKLKLDLPYVVLAVLFGVSPQTCKTTFHTIVATLSPIMMKSTILFPSAKFNGIYLCVSRILKKLGLC